MKMYSAKVINEIKHDKGWNTVEIGVFHGARQVGMYARNYPTMHHTFYPFRVGEQWYALYSPKYTVTRIMELPSCRDIGGEEVDSNGFCPVEYYVPQMQRIVTMVKHQVEQPFAGFRYDNEHEFHNPFDADPDEKIISIETKYLPFGFVSGCRWGDDGSWKIQHLDLSQAAEGVLKKTDLIGYRELPFLDVRLKDCIQFIELHDAFILEEQLGSFSIDDATTHRFKLAITDPMFYDWDCKDGKGERRANY